MLSVSVTPIYKAICVPSRVIVTCLFMFYLRFVSSWFIVVYVYVFLLSLIVCAIRANIACFWCVFFLILVYANHY